MTFEAPPPDAPRNDGAAYPSYITWHAQGSAEKGIPPAQFSIRATGAGELPMPCPQIATGVVWDIENIETGWLSWPNGSPKDYRPNPKVSQPAPFPGAGFTENIRIPIAIDANTVTMWDQASAGSWKGFCQVAAAIHQQAPQNPGMLPVVAFTGATLTSTGKNSTQVPNFQIMSWVARPPCLAAHLQPQAAPPNGEFQQAAPPPAAPAAAWGAPAPAAAPAPAQPQPAAAPAAAPGAAPPGAWT